MKSRYWCILWILSFIKTYTQNLNSSEYFQQQVNYKISVQLNDVHHSLKGFEEIEYINNSPDTLRYIYFHLWPNAYKNQSTCLAQQFLKFGDRDFYFSKPEERGYIDSLNFQINNNKCRWKTLKDTIDIAVLYLNEPLLPHQSIKITTPFYVKIPSAKFSRLGHLGNAYYITQWYPKPAVYDRYGWHPMPYLHNGEFFSEYGQYDVRITLPKNYVLAATGNRIADEEEEQFLNQRIRLTQHIIANTKDTVLSDNFPESSKEYKTVRFIENNVHDFAWFADKRFLVLKDEIELFESKKKINTWLYFTPKNINLWKKALEYINEATLFYSYFVGDYPYNNISAVDGSTAAGGGMEYPTITLINQSSTDKQLEETIVHEIGHNWFYGILGTNERDYPAMDEGINSFYEMRYLYKKYPELKLSETFGIPQGKKFLGIEKIPQKKYYEWSYKLLATHNADMPILWPSEKYTELNYGGIVYCKTAFIIEYLKNFYGEEVFDEAMAFYFKAFKFKHPYPEDFKILLNYFGGGDNIPLLENIILTRKRIDYEISKIRKNENNVYELTITNKGQMTAPIVIQAIKDNKVVAEIWKNNITQKETISFPPLQADYFKIDYNEITPDLNRRNNTIKTTGLFKKTEPLQLNFGWKVDDFYKTQVHHSPLVAWNFNDGTMIGWAFYNYGIFPKKVEGFIAPMYALKSKTIVGSRDVYFNFFPEKKIKLLQFGVATKSYSYLYGKTIDNKTYFNQYLKIEPYSNILFQQKDPTKKERHYLTLRSVILLDRESLQPILNFTEKSYWMNEYKYTFEKNSAISPFSIELKLQHNNAIAKSFVTLNGKFYTNTKKFFEYRIFAGKFLNGVNILNAPYAYRPSGYSNTQDYLMDYYYFGRYQYDVFYRQQFIEAEGGLKVWTALGYSQDWMSSINLYSPSIAGFRLFADLVVSDQKYLNVSSNTYSKALYDAGIQFSVRKFLNIYFPLLMSDVLKDNLKLNGFEKWFQWIRYSIHLNRINPRFEAAKRIE